VSQSPKSGSSYSDTEHPHYKLLHLKSQSPKSGSSYSDLKWYAKKLVQEKCRNPLKAGQVIPTKLDNGNRMGRREKSQSPKSGSSYSDDAEIEENLNLIERVAIP